MRPSVIFQFSTGVPARSTSRSSIRIESYVYIVYMQSEYRKIRGVQSVRAAVASIAANLRLRACARGGRGPDAVLTAGSVRAAAARTLVSNDGRSSSTG